MKIAEASVYGEIFMESKFGILKFKHRDLFADIVDEYMLDVDFMKQYGIVLDLKETIIRVNREEIPLH